jgi:hypothetical protein
MIYYSGKSIESFPCVVRIRGEVSLSGSKGSAVGLLSSENFFFKRSGKRVVYMPKIKKAGKSALFIRVSVWD